METPHQFGVASAGERWKRGCGGETFGRFRPNWPSPTKSSSHLLLRSEEPVPKKNNARESPAKPPQPPRARQNKSTPFGSPTSSSFLVLLRPRSPQSRSILPQR